MGTTTASALSSNGFHDGRASGVCMPVVAPVPKEFSDELKIRAVALLVELKNASAAAEQLMREFPGTQISGQTIARWGKGLPGKLLVKGRRKGAPGAKGARGPTGPRSPFRDRIFELLAEGKTQAEIARELGTTRQNVSIIIRRN